MNYKNIRSYSQKTSILFLESDQEFLEEVEKYLRVIFKEIELVTNYQNGLEQYKKYYLQEKNFYDIVVMKMEACKKKNDSFIEEIKSLNEKQEIVVLLDMEESVGSIGFIPLGIDDILFKPIRNSDIEVCLYNVLKRIYKNKIAIEQ